MILRSGNRALILTVLLGLCGTFATWAASVTLMWDANSEPDLAGYKVYYGYESVTTLDVGNTTSIRLPELVPGKTYSFYVTAYNVAGLESEPSEMIFYDVPAKTQAEGSRDGALAMSRNGNSLSFASRGLPGQVYELQACDNLARPDWLTVRSVTADGNGDFSIEVNGLLSQPKLFFRTVAVQE